MNAAATTTTTISERVRIYSSQEGMAVKEDWIVKHFDDAVLKESLPAHLSGEFFAFTPFLLISESLSLSLTEFE